MYNGRMLAEWFGKIEDRKIVCLREFFRSGWYLAAVVLAMALANLFSLELPVFYFYLFLELAVVLFAEDLKGAIPLLLCCCFTVSEKNNPALYVPGEAHVSAFYLPSFRIQLAILIAVAVISLLIRLMTLLWRSEKRNSPALLSGFLALGVSFVTGGAFSPYYRFKTAFFGLAEFAALGGSYLFVYYAVDWKRSEKDYFAKLLTAIGVGVIIELIGIYAYHFDIFTGDAQRGVLVTGWGMYNNVGCMIAICLPAPLYLAAIKERGRIFTAVGFLFFFALVMTQSRGSVLFGGIIFLAALALLFCKSGRNKRRANLLVMGAAAALCLILIAIFREKLLSIFGDALGRTFGDIGGGDVSNGRIRIYQAGIEKFLQAPVFGVGFYEVDAVVFRWGKLSQDAFLPPRYHNTYIQFLAAGGIFSLLCYVCHRVQTLSLLMRDLSTEKLFLALSVSALLFTSILDCHFFNLGPGLFYGAALAFLEGEDLRKEKSFHTCIKCVANG